MQDAQEIQVQSLGWEDPLEEKMAPTPVFFPGKFHGQWSLLGYSPWDGKECDMTAHTHTHTHTIGLVTDFPLCLLHGTCSLPRSV